MFRRTYYVQRAERRNDGGRVLRDTSFASFMCILFIFALFTCLIVIVFNWRFLFLVEDEIEYFDHSNRHQNENEFEKISILVPPNLSEEKSREIIYDSTNNDAPITGISIKGNNIGGGNFGTTQSDRERKTDSGEIATVNEMKFSGFSSLFATSTRSSVPVSAYDVNQVEQETTTELQSTILTLTSNGGQTESKMTETTETTVETSMFQVIRRNKTENLEETEEDSEGSGGFSSTAKLQETTETTQSTEGTTLTDQDSEESRHVNSEIQTTDWKRDAMTDSTDLIDLDTTDSGRIFYGPTGFRTTPYWMKRTKRYDYPIVTQTTDETTEATESTESTEATEVVQINSTDRTEMTQFTEGRYISKFSTEQQTTEIQTETTPSTDSTTMTTSFEDSAVRLAIETNEKSKLRQSEKRVPFSEKQNLIETTVTTPMPTTTEAKPTLYTSTKSVTYQLGPLAQRLHLNVNDDIDYHDMYDELEDKDIVVDMK